MYLKDSQELYQDCEFISKKTRSIYAWRAALWVRYCKERKMDFSVTEDKLITYLDWLFEIDLVNKINTKKSYVPDILRDHMGSVICLWRIQTGNDPDLVSPKEGTRYQSKWDEILRNYPRRDRFQTRSYMPDGRSPDNSMTAPPQTQAGYPYNHRDMSAAATAAGSGTGGASSSGYNSYRDYRGYDSAGHHYTVDSKSSYHYNHQSPHSSLLPPPHSSQHPYQGYNHQYPHTLEYRQPTNPETGRSQSQHYHHHNQNQQQNQQHAHYSRPQTQPAVPRYPIALSDTAEMDWQLSWILGGSWAHSVARFLFTISMATWVEAIDVVGIRLLDVYFASSTLAPRLPSSVLRITLMTNTVPGYRQQLSGDTSSITPAVRQQFSIIRSRSPLTCAWNALSMLLFHRWHVAESLPPTFANSAWQNTLVIPAFSKGSIPSLAGNSGIADGALSEMAAESGQVSISERLGLVRDLLSEDKMPVQSVLRTQALHHARQLGINPVATVSPLRDQRSAQGESSWAQYSSSTENEALDRLAQLATANSGYFESHHTIQRHKVIPPKTLQQTIFPWANKMLSEVPSSLGLNERRHVSRFLDFLLDLRIILLQDIAILKCCAHYLPQDYDMTSILHHKLFNTPEFSRYCEKMQADAADEIRALQHSLDTAMDDEEMYRDTARVSGVDNMPAMPSVAPSHREDSGMMMVGSPDGESFSPTISPSPPKQDGRISSQHPVTFMGSPRSTDDRMIHTPTTAPQQMMSHSMPSRPFEEINDDMSFNAIRARGNGGPLEDHSMATASAAAGATGSISAGAAIPSAKRRRPEIGSNPAHSGLYNPAVGPETPYPGASPRIGHRHTSSHRSQRITRSPPNMHMRSPGLGGSSRLGQSILPSISQFAYHTNLSTGSNAGGSPMLVNSPNLGRGGNQQRMSISGVSSHRRDNADVYMSSGGLRRASDTVTEGSAGGGSAGGGMGVGRDDLSRNDIEQIGQLREENALLRQRLNDLEITVVQKHAEMHDWMSRVEKHIQSRLSPPSQGQDPAQDCNHPNQGFGQDLDSNQLLDHKLEQGNEQHIQPEPPKANII
ncbi:hypothetical protein IWW45_004174 [Coemansia sp. RSA 485]|nr:hypothetical protein IWW45_004174 [Coemansia sp. RSA 485]